MTVPVVAAKKPVDKPTMKVIAITLLAFSLGADAFVIHGSKPSSSTTTSLKDVGLQWGFDENGCRNEYYLEHWTEHNKDLPQSQWAYDRPWSGVSQTIFIPRDNEVTAEIQQRFATRDILGSAAAQVNVQAQQKQRAFALPAAQPARPMPEVNVAAPHIAAHQMLN
mmetsp:Transcript_12042/g.28823  ORF Transcript_12042/g.28823 Transcript_12042/m.28823 type:complete len:166 (+) Transcript_12042:15-512(+)